MSLKSKHIVLGVSGSIAAYKAVSLLRLLQQKGAEVKVIMTPAAKEFVGPLSFATLSRGPVISEFFDKADGSWNSHVDLGLWADVFLVAPATASTLSKMAYGQADNILVTSYLSTRAPVWLAPAMDLDMYQHPSVQRALEVLREHGCKIIEPANGYLASGLVGKGRMPEPEDIVAQLEKEMARKQDGLLSGKRVLITSGPTQENIDPVRFISNYSSGKMGAALAEAASKNGAEVYFITGPAEVLPQKAYLSLCREVDTALEMAAAVDELLTPEVDIAIFCAAVADYRVAEVAEQKIKRTDGEDLYLRLIPNPDIAATAAKKKLASQYFIGFALETEHAMENARSKMQRKGLDAIVLNRANTADTGFGADTNEVCILEAGGKIHKLPLQPKQQIAEGILAALFGEQA